MKRLTALLCLFGLHKWSQPETYTIECWMDWMGTQDDCARQRRTCLRCGETDEE